MKLQRNARPSPSYGYIHQFQLGNEADRIQ